MPSNCHTDCELPRCESCAGCTSDVGELRERGSDLMCQRCITARDDGLAVALARERSETLSRAGAVNAALLELCAPAQGAPLLTTGEMIQRQEARYRAALQEARDLIEDSTDGPCTPFVMVSRAIAAARLGVAAPVPGPCSVTRIADPIANALFAALGLRDDQGSSDYMTADGHGA